MGTLLRRLTSLGAAAALLAATGCSSLPVQTWQDVTMPTYPPRDPATVQILREAPTQANVKLGEITAEPQSMSIPIAAIEAKLRQAGARMGADVVVLVVETRFTAAAMTNRWWNGRVNSDTGEIFIGVPIRYTSQGVTRRAQLP
jgi:hypothetical protein